MQAYTTGQKHRDGIILKLEQSLKMVGEMDEGISADDLQERARDVAI